jgi:very-short-patch-repair endonuclease
LYYSHYLCDNLTTMERTLLTLNKTTIHMIRAYYIVRARWFRLNRLLFPSPAELKLVEIMGGKIVAISFIRHPQTGFPLSFVLHLGKALSTQKFAREIKAGKYWLDFGNDILWGIEVDGKKFHRDVVREYDRHEYLTGFCDKKCKKDCQKHLNVGWRVMHIAAIRLWNEPAVVQHEVLKFLAS